MRRYKKGSFTIEITILMPFILTVMIILSFFVLYLYNRNVMQNAVSRGAKQCFYYENETNEKIQKECEKTVLADLEQYLVGINKVELEVSVTKYKVKIGVIGKLNVPELIMLEDISLDGLWNYEIEAEESRLKPAELLRNGEQIKDIFDVIGKEEKDNGD